MIERDILLDWVCSYAGCDGGNVCGETWLCGIEWGGRAKKSDYQVGLVQDINAKPVLKTAPDAALDWVDRLQRAYRYDRAFIKMHAAMRGKDISSYKDHAQEMTKNNEILKLNLYPIGFQDTSARLWNEYGLEGVTGFGDKYTFNTWCLFNRSKFFTDERKKHQPRRIICVGVSYLRDFLMFFGYGENLKEINLEMISPASEANKNDRYLYWTRLHGDRNETLLFIIPFFNVRSGLNSDHLLQSFGRRIAELSQ